MNEARPLRILIIKTHAIGDLLMTTPAIRDIRGAHPQAHITLLVGKWSSPAIRWNPHIDERIEVEDTVFLGRRNWRVLFALLFKIRRLRFDKAFVFHPLPAVHLFARLAGIPERYGLVAARGSRHLTAAVQEKLGPDDYYPDNFLRVAALDGVKTGAATLEVHTAAADEDAAEQALRAAGLEPGADYVLVAPGGGRNSKEDVAAKRWPTEHFIAVIRDLQRRRPGLPVILTGAGSDRVETGAVVAAMPHVIDLTGKTSLRALFSLTRRARAVLCNDTALLHVAVACGTPVVAAFGPTSRARFLPPARREDAVQSTLACSPCYVGGHFPGCTIGYQCMREIGPEVLGAKLESVLNRPRGVYGDADVPGAS